MAVQSDNKIIVAGWSDSITSGPVGPVFALVRYNPNGSLDTTFNATGKVTTAIGVDDDEGYSMSLQSDGKIVVGGSSFIGGRWVFALVRYNANGSLDTTFNGTGKVTTAIGSDHDYGRSVAIQSDGKIILAGSSRRPDSGLDFALVRYNTNGSLDTTFNAAGKVTTAFVGGVGIYQSVAIQNNGKILLAGYMQNSGTPNTDFATARYNTDGSLDTFFGGTGKVTTDTGNNTDYGQAVAVQIDGNVLVAGLGGGGAAVVRYLGGLDTDGDGIPDEYETGTGIYVSPTNTGTSPTNSDTDGDGIPDRYETGTGIYVSPTNTGTNPTNPDTDGDGLNDGQEVNTYHSNPVVRDTDGDGFDDGFEVSTGFSPTSSASTPDALSSIRTAAEYRFNAANGNSYRIEASTDLANWSTIETPIIGAGGVITRFYSIEGQPRRFFRSRRN